MAADPAFPASIQNKSIELAAADTTTAKALNTALGGTGGLMQAMYIVNSHTAGVFVDIFRAIGGTDYLLQTVWVPPGSGTDGSGAHVPCLDVMALGLFSSSLNNNNQYELPVDATMVIKVGMNTTLAGGKVTVSADFKLY